MNNPDYGVYKVKVSGYTNVIAGSPEKAEEMVCEKYFDDFDGDLGVDEVELIEQVTERV